jgi:hypothetical protein
VDVEVSGHEREPSIARPWGEPTRGEVGVVKHRHVGPLCRAK